MIDVHCVVLYLAVFVFFVTFARRLRARRTRGIGIDSEVPPDNFELYVSFACKDVTAIMIANEPGTSATKALQPAVGFTEACICICYNR